MRHIHMVFVVSPLWFSVNFIMTICTYYYEIPQLKRISKHSSMYMPSPWNNEQALHNFRTFHWCQGRLIRKQPDVYLRITRQLITHNKTSLTSIRVIEGTLNPFDVWLCTENKQRLYGEWLVVRGDIIHAFGNVYVVNL